MRLASPSLLNQEALGNPTSNPCVALAAALPFCKKGIMPSCPRGPLLTQVWSCSDPAQPRVELCDCCTSGCSPARCFLGILCPSKNTGFPALERGKSHLETPAHTESRVSTLPIPTTALAREEQRSRLGRLTRPRRGQLPEKPAAAAEVLHFYLWLLYYLPQEVKAQTPTPTVSIPG